MYTPQQINEVTFSKAMIGGYDMNSVDEFLEPLIQDYETLYSENATLKTKLKVLADKVNAQTNTEAAAKETLAKAKKAADKMIREAEAKAAKILADAQAAAAESAKGDAENRIAEIQAQLNACVQALEQIKAANGHAAEAELPVEQKPALTGKASIDKPWMKYYPAGIEQMMVIPQIPLTQFLKLTCKGMDLPVINYYGSNITWKEFFCMVDEVARAMKATGLGEGDQIPVMLRAVPEFLVLLLAAEKIGASLLCRDNTIEENAEAVQKSGAKLMFVHDYITQAEVDAYTAAGAECIVTVNPMRLAVREEMPDYIQAQVDACYTADQATHGNLVSWEDYVVAGRVYFGKVEAPEDINRPLYRCYTSGSTGTSKQVIHSAKTMLGVIGQMTGYGNADGFRPTWLLVCLPPALVAVTVSMMLVPMASDRVLILDPFVDIYDVDLELMRYKPNNFPLIPMMMEILMTSKRIPADYDLSHLLACGAGAEASNNGQIKRAQKFLDDHNCHVTFSTSYGQSEACSNITFPAPGVPFGNGNVGIPMPLNSMGIFRGTDEIAYNKLGEICITGPGIMLGYDNEEATSKTLIRHEDGQLWLHTGDTGYITEDGILYTLGRGLAKRWHEDKQKRGRLVDIQMENLISDADIPGVEDCFFVTRPDPEHEGFFVPYMYVVLEDGVTVKDVEPYALQALNDYQHPVEIIQVPERPFYHFKTNRLHMEAPYAR